MTNPIYESITNRKIALINRRREALPLEQLKELSFPSDRDFMYAISNFHTNFILELMRATPEKGLLRTDLNINEIASIYGRYADAISVVINEHLYGGHPDDLLRVREAVTQPILASCFVVDEYQIYEARHLGADAVTLTVSLNNDDQLHRLIDVCHSLRMTPVLTVRNEEEVRRALATDVPIIKINNPDITSSVVDVETTERMAAMIPENRIKIAGSKILDNRDIMKLKGICSAFVVGSPILEQSHLICAVKSVVFGAVKISGITSVEDANMALQAGAAYLGLVLSDGRPRKIDLETAAKICALPEGLMIGVFVDDPIETIATIAANIQLQGVQLHGDEDADYIRQLRTKLPPGTLIFKGVPILDRIPDLTEIPADYFVIDTFDYKLRGGTGRSFDWSYLADSPLLDKIFLAGGINPISAQDARLVGTFGLDITSGVEKEIGVKDPKKLEHLFQVLR